MNITQYVCKVTGSFFALVVLLCATRTAPAQKAAWDYPAGKPEVYQPSYPRELDPSLRWIQSDRLRIAWGWITSSIKYIDNAQHQHEFADVAELAVQSGFNVVIPNAPCRGKQQAPYHLWANLEGMTRVRLLGARTLFNTGYTWRYDDDPAGAYDRFVSGDGKTDAKQICPLEPYPWRDNLARPVLDALDEAERLGVPDLFFGVMFDVEVQASMGNGADDTYGFCHNDRCWTAFANSGKSGGAIDPKLPLIERKAWLAKHGRTETYQRWQKQAVTDLVRAELEPIRARAPHLVFGMYPFHRNISWMTESVAVAVSTRRAPAILMDDQTYYTGWTDKPDYVEPTRAATIELLGYEPFFCPSIDYAEQPPYGSMKVDQAGREAYLLTRAATGVIVYAGSRNPLKDLLEDQREFYTGGFAPAFRLLEEQGIVDHAVAPSPDPELRQRLEGALAQLHREVESMWGDVHGVAFAHVDVPASGAFDGTSPAVLIKELSQSRIYNTTAADYSFDLSLSRAPAKASLELTLEPRDAARTRVHVKVNGQSIEHPVIVVPPDGRVSVVVPPSLIKEKTLVSIAYFYRDSYAETRFDNSLIVRQVQLMLE